MTIALWFAAEPGEPCRASGRITGPLPGRLRNLHSSQAGLQGRYPAAYAIFTRRGPVRRNFRKKSRPQFDNDEFMI